MALVGVAGALTLAFRGFGELDVYLLGSLFLIGFFFFLFAAPPPPKTLTKEWQEAENERAKELNLNPITGIFLSPFFWL